MHPGTVVLVLTTWPAAANPAAFAAALVEEGLAACVNLLPEMESIYRWEGRVARERERQVVMKTVAGRLEALKGRLAELHPYEVPELLVIEVADGGEAYFGWLRESTR